MDECGIQAQPRHLRMAYCPCQYAEEVLLNKQPKKKEPERASCCSSFNQRLAKYGFNMC